MSRRKTLRRWVEPQDFRDLRRQAGLTRREAAAVLDVTGRTVQNWETGGAHVPWLAFRMLRILQGYALPGSDWDGWTVQGDTLTAPNGRHFTAGELQHIEQVFAMSRLWRQDYTARSRKPAACGKTPAAGASHASGAGEFSTGEIQPAKVLTFPERAQTPAELQQAPQGHLKLIGGAS